MQGPFTIRFVLIDSSFILARVHNSLGLHTEKIDRGGGRGNYPYANAHGHLGGLPQEIVVFRVSYIASGAF